MNELYKSYLRTLNADVLADETIQVLTDADAPKIEACRARWIELNNADKFIDCYNKAVDKMTEEI